MRFSQYVNKKKAVCGHLWKGRYYSCILDDRHLFAAVRYVENNPVRAGIVESPQEYRWSSAAAHVLGEGNPVLTSDCYLKDEIKNWRTYLQEEEDDRLVENIRNNSLSGRPCGDDSFIQRLECSLDRKLSTLPRGRPRKNSDK